MLYQLAIYALSRSTDARATILYATTAMEAREARIEIRDPVRQRRLAQVILRPVNLLRLDGLLAGAGSVAEGRERATYARWLALGEG